MATLDSSAGAFLVGAMLSCAGMGILCVQAFAYFTTFHNDHRLVFWMVAALMSIELFKTFAAVATPYKWIVTSYGDPIALASPPWTFKIELGLTGTVSTVVQLFFAHRIYMLLGRRRGLPGLVVLLAFAQWSLALATMGKAFELKEFGKFFAYRYGVVGWLVVAVLNDIAITGSLAYGLGRQKRSEFHHTNSVIDSLLRNIIQTNALTTVVSIATTVLFAVQPDKGWFAISDLIISKLFLNSMLESLNSRARLSERLQASKNETVKVNLGTHGRLETTESCAMTGHRTAPLA